ncbi:response regulator [Fibrivirga algicola]|uniref:Response regulator n=1 Tax=Fibrivirga algicola TaxID=2950420 RepID=A0ABX0QBD5_9BACT|nr:response regulator [Fibrivirga algicola]ARK13217.1 hypothetical protein A6C57_24370 [Fibrella sp. ES10-3-2-2]NID09188.1 response regulator [Fibrivirga algicola]
MVGKPTNKAFVYIVDDADDYRFLVQQVFTRFMPQYDTSFFAGGTELLTQLDAASVQPSLILLDLHMPGMDGQQTLLRLKQNPAWKLIPVVVITSSSSAQEVQACYEAGANSCLVKPIDMQTMRQLLEQVCLYWVETNGPLTVGN